MKSDHFGMLTRRRFLTLTTIGGATLAAGPAVLWSAEAQAKSAVQTLSIGRDQDDTTFDPILTIQNADIWVLDNMNANLVRVTYNGKGLEPDLAESWKVSDSGQHYTFKLRDGIKFF